jgi:fructokinase
VIISLGEALIDFISVKGLEFQGFPGGSPFNTAVAIARQGVSCRYLGRVSEDLFGNQLMDYLEKNHVSTEMAFRTDDASTLSFIQKQPDGQALYAFFSNGTADRFWTGEELENCELPSQAKMMHFGSISLSQEPCGSVLSRFIEEKASHLLLSFDPNIRPSLVPDREVYMERFRRLCRISGIVKLSDEDLDWLFPGIPVEKAVSQLLDEGVSLVALTEGKAGARLVTPSHSVSSPLYDLPVSDTVGAGDTFHGALLSFLYKRECFDKEAVRRLSPRALEELGSFANKAAGINCSRTGADPPSAADMESQEFLLE